MWSALIVFVLQSILQSCVSGDGTYECGDHGRFEYCIDEIPGCVIGCHCHPGYYFDTDTKICEPNTRLIEHYRRENVLKTTRDQKIEVTPNTVLNDTDPASTYKIDGSVDEIAKDANDLGDWLYNQFFKTIENQVINNTNDKDILTRRGASQPTIKIPNKSKKPRKGGKSSKQKGKKEQLRRKLLRITENDSLFDLSSKSSSDSSDSCSSEDLSSMDYEVNESNHHKHDDDEHGHKKIVMINKKPKRPLPSFIFLPNLDTPFYPPIGLPPPPIVPMYPMVPVPPVPLCPITGCIDNGNVATTTSAPTTIAAPTTTTAPAPTTASVSTVLTDTTVPSSVPETTDDTTTTDAAKTDTRALRLKNKKKKKAAKFLNNDTSRADTGQGINNLKYFERQKILERLKEKMGNPSAKLFGAPLKKIKKNYSNKFIDHNVDTESQFLDNGIVDNEFLNNDRNQKLMQEDGSLPDNVDFKYITELIHRVDLNNKSNDLPPIEYNPLDSIELHKKQFSDYSVPLYTPDGRRTSRPMHHKSDESYYANLGRQIATMIRGIDTQENVELEETSNKIKNDPYFNNNSPSSFWERSVRSPLAYLKTKNKKFEYLKRSNELLFDMENKVEIIASTAPSLTLQEIENIVKVMEAAKKKIQSKNKSSMKNPGTSRRNLNIDLWPEKSRDSRNNFQNSVLPYFNKIKQEKNANNYKSSKNNIVKPNVNLPDLRMHSSQKFVAWNGQNTNRIIKPINQTHNIPTLATPLFNKKYAQINYNFENTNKIHQIPAVANPFSQNTIKQSFLNQQINPYLLHRRKYFQDNSNSYYVNRNVKLSYFSPVKRISGVPQLYFPEINHFDYID
ncbi:uncharacterized protein [Maniola hyperantus]|uniref:uncharacterized protein n=1 Tax=Aphantopus hyperantus TaxID=2795564 RepID=UPI0015684181|nr:uncharacterized protein LOC117991486 [Maniola hyperantus]